MAEDPAASRQPVLKPLSEVNHEPGAQTISTVVKLLNAIMEPLTKRDWRYQDKVPQTGGVIFVPNHISNADPLAVGQYLAFSGRWPRFLARHRCSGSRSSDALSRPAARFRSSADRHGRRTRLLPRPRRSSKAARW